MGTKDVCSGKAWGVGQCRRGWKAPSHLEGCRRWEPRSAASRWHLRKGISQFLWVTGAAGSLWGVARSAGGGSAWGSRHCINKMAGQDGAGCPGHKGVCVCARRWGRGPGQCREWRCWEWRCPAHQGSIADRGGSGTAAGRVRFWGAEGTVPSRCWELSMRCS